MNKNDQKKNRISLEEAIRRICKAVEDASCDPADLPEAGTKEGDFLIDVYELMCKYDYNFFRA